MEEIQQPKESALSKEAKPQKSAVREIAEAVLVAVALAFLIRYFLFQPFYIPSGSMEPTLKPLDRIIVSKVNYWFSEPALGQIIVFRYPVDPSRDFVKRVIAVGGETVKIRNNQVYVNDRPIPEPYLPPNLRMSDYGPVTVPEGKFFVMGDNRNHSDDSRIWGFVPRDNVIGQAVFLYWPFDRIRTLGGT
ncbi:signal peptidase i [Heliomicrobium modesticaldum Ice1]|uniref:Signal peptidase I n=1 Tax=Heliobacterium modesticaldum (strain ATCC 51547 / Ice1) TaxID=498761 RepID=B0TH70_HELMI|nr:signal peptidase I [Heliomicrobium modesticaldum]ABZ84745.1 signal peptidase i [Heliomicrobium modesticaldum Ice1]